ncbi:MAG TPA: Hsp20/alpha crystallin family protein [Gammaproteobacteria bacterium]|jgi:HSP20 family protein|nr:heat-shock protein Hsp20 [Gammaproteobacteria bacterium]HBK77384.1 heat-shock protein Hsp20 [Gammaproteobacteria bacterium]HHZ73148.1 Hsp20/alpha crystallin family protein [Gammaproteobacteria bacterium]HIB06600.1 Hsp20/alpha crystallin family protein [Gammaproteobacteria bacterium]HIB82694.1 Hsp20/alpha crystallin family protein [Gammaproteobacteria bacterium]
MESIMNNLVRIADGRRPWGFFPDVDGILRGFYDSPVSTRNTNADSRRLAMDVIEDDTAYVVTTDMPGISREEVSVTIDKNVLTISAEPKDEVSKNERKVLRHERYSGKYSRSLRLGEDIEEDKVSAEYRDGVLRLTIPKKTPLAPRQVEVKIN